MRLPTGKFLGHAIAAGPWTTKGVRPEFQAMLDAAEPKINEELKKSGNASPKNYCIKSVGGFRGEISVHGAGVAIDIDGGDNPYIMHEGDVQGTDTTLSTELRPVYHNIAEFMLNDPVDGGQSIVPKLIGSGGSLSKGRNSTRRERLEQYYDRLDRRNRTDGLAKQRQWIERHGPSYKLQPSFGCTTVRNNTSGTSLRRTHRSPGTVTRR